jgi:hypothetical protein
MSEELAKLESDKLEQMQLTLEGEPLYVDRDELPCRYTAERFKAYYPDRYRAAVQLLAAGQFSEGEIAKFVHADYRTIRQVAVRCIDDVEVAREMIRKQSLGLIVAFGERAFELIERAQKPSEVMIPMGIAKDIYLQIGGLPTARIEIDHRIDCGAELAALLRAAEEKVKTIEATVIEETEVGGAPALQTGEVTA